MELPYPLGILLENFPIMPRFVGTSSPCPRGRQERAVRTSDTVSRLECWGAFYLSAQQAEAGACLVSSKSDRLTGVGVRGRNEKHNQLLWPYWKEGKPITMIFT